MIYTHQPWDLFFFQSCLAMAGVRQDRTETGNIDTPVKTLKPFKGEGVVSFGLQSKLDPLMGMKSQCGLLHVYESNESKTPPVLQPDSSETFMNSLCSSPLIGSCSTKQYKHFNFFRDTFCLTVWVKISVFWFLCWITSSLPLPTHCALCWQSHTFWQWTSKLYSSAGECPCIVHSHTHPLSPHDLYSAWATISQIDGGTEK